MANPLNELIKNKKCKKETAGWTAEPSNRRYWDGKILLLGELIFPRAAQGAHPVGGNLLPGSAGGHAVVGVTLGGIVDIAAEIADVLIHIKTLLLFHSKSSGGYRTGKQPCRMPCPVV